jgi:hypothetical protein
MFFKQDFLGHKKPSEKYFFFSFGVLQLMFPEAPQPYGLLYYPRFGHYNFLHKLHAATPTEQRKLKL